MQDLLLEIVELLKERNMANQRLEEAFNSQSVNVLKPPYFFMI